MQKWFVGPTLVIAGGLLVLGSLGLWALGSQDQARLAAPLPASLAGLPLVSSETGTQAIAEIGRLHRRTFPATSGAMATYGFGSTRATIWVAGFENDEVAGAMLDAMRSSIAQGNGPFTPTGERSQAGRMVYELSGMEQRHFYFQSTNRVLWLAVAPTISETALEQMLEAFP